MSPGWPWSGHVTFTKCKCKTYSTLFLFTFCLFFFVIRQNISHVRGTWKYDDPRLKMSHGGVAQVWHFQLRVVIFPCPTHYHASSVNYDTWPKTSVKTIMSSPHTERTMTSPMIDLFPWMAQEWHVANMPIQRLQQRPTKTCYSWEQLANTDLSERRLLKLRASVYITDVSFYFLKKLHCHQNLGKTVEI